MVKTPILALCALCAVATAVAAAAAPGRFEPSATTCATYVSPAFVERLTGLTVTPETKPPGVCDFAVGGVRDALSLSIAAFPSSARSAGTWDESWSFMSAQSTTASIARATGVGTKALWFRSSAGASGVYAYRGDEVVDLNVGASVTLATARELALVKALFAKLPR